MSERVIRFFLAGMFASILILLAACSAASDAPEDDTPEGMARISLRLSAAPNSTRADENATADEMMNNYIVIIVNDKGIIEKYFAKDVSQSEEETIGSGSKNIMITKGKKTIYSFANMTLNQATGLDAEPTAGATEMPDISTRTFTTQGNSASVPSGGIPMSNVQEFDIQGDSIDDNALQLRVKRLYAKLHLKITNNLDSDITIDTLTISGITPNGTAVPLLPPTAAAAASSASTLSILSTESSESLSTISTISTKSSETVTFYLNESGTPDNDFGLFIIDIVYTQDGVQQPRRYAMISTDTEGVKDKTEGSDDWYDDTAFDIINRNDYLDIPIVIDDYRLGLNVVDFAPIAVVTTVKAVDNYTLCRFTMPDIHFHLIPIVKHGSENLTLNTDFTMTTSDGSYITTHNTSGTLYASSSGESSGSSGDASSSTTGSDASHNGGSPVWDADKGFFFGKIAESPDKGAYAVHSITAKINNSDITLRYYFKVVYEPQKE